MATWDPSILDEKPGRTSHPDASLPVVTDDVIADARLFKRAAGPLGLPAGGISRRYDRTKNGSDLRNLGEGGWLAGPRAKCCPPISGRDGRRTHHVLAATTVIEVGGRAERLHQVIGTFGLCSCTSCGLGRQRPSPAFDVYSPAGNGPR
jgi:hypothetical protein